MKNFKGSPIFGRCGLYVLSYLDYKSLREPLPGDANDNVPDQTSHKRSLLVMVQGHTAWRLKPLSQPITSLQVIDKHVLYANRLTVGILSTNNNMTLFW